MLSKEREEKKSSFSEKSFQAPSREYFPIYSWVWNAPVSKEETDRQLDEFVRLGIKAIYIIPEPKSFRPGRMPTLMEPDYLTEPYFQEYKYALEAAFDRGMFAWIYDEGGWPSGGACGKVLTEHPELSRRILKSQKKQVLKGETYERDDTVFASFLGDEQIESGFLAKEDVTVTEYLSHRSYFENPPIPDYPDLTRAEATDAFIDSTHNKYKEHIGNHFGKNVFAVFTDEPTAPRPTPFYAELVSEYETRYGESIIPYLPALLKEKQPTREDAEALIKWYDLISEKFCENFLLRTKKWCNENDLKFVGHMDVDNTPDGCMRGGNFHLMRALRCFDIPGIDVIWRQIFPCEKMLFGDDMIGENQFFPRYASSAAAHIGSSRTLSETFGVYGNGLTYEQMRWVIGFQAIRGINLFNPMLVSYGRQGYLLAGELPSFREDYACYGDLKVFNEYVARLCYLLTLGERKADTAVYLSMRDIWAGINREKAVSAFESAGVELEKAGIDFDVVDDDVLTDCNKESIECGKIEIGNAKYTTVIIPWCEYMPENTRKRLCEFAKSGGRVFLINSPITIENALKTENCKNVIKPSLDFVAESDCIRIHERIADNARIVALYNQGLNRTKLSVTVGKEKVFFADINRGVLRCPEVLDGRITLEIESGETVALLFTNEEYLSDKSEYSSAIEINSKVSFKKTKELVISNMKASLKEVKGEVREVSLGDWRSFCGTGFSGSGLYKTNFNLSSIPRGKAAIDLGEVKHSAEVYLNGRSLGVRVMSPYAFEFDASILKEKNTLEIRVSNSAANAFSETDLWENFAKWQLSPYFIKQNTFDKDSLAGGLIGPVTLKY